jgi:hypothetical protein
MNNDQAATRRDLEEVHGTVETHLEEAPMRNVPEIRAITTSEADADRGLLKSEDCKKFRSRWETLQIGFVDDPRNAVDQARQLVKEAVNQLRETLADTEHNLDQHYRQPDASTEEQRLALQQYRSFFERLLTV